MNPKFETIFRMLEGDGKRFKIRCTDLSGKFSGYIGGPDYFTKAQLDDKIKWLKENDPQANETNYIPEEV